MTQPLSAEPRFEYVGGDPALDLINTVDWTSRGPEHERLESYEQLTRWAEGAGVIDASIGRRVRRLGEARPRAAAAALAFAIQARGSLHDLFGAIARGDQAEPGLARFNRLLQEALRGLEVAPITGPMYQLFIFFMITDPKTTVQTKWGQCIVAFLVALVEMMLRLHESVHAPYYALFLVGPTANLIEIWWYSRQSATASAPHPA